MASTAPAPSSSQAQAATLALASSMGLSLRADWLEAVARAGAGTNPSASSMSMMASPPMTAEALVSLVLNADLNSAGGGGALPADLEPFHGRALTGRRIVQVDEVVNAAASSKHRYAGAPVSGRMLKLLVTDGSRHVVAFEMEPVPALSADLAAGCKIALTDPLVLRGMLALRPANVAVLGGGVPRLEAARARARAEWSKPPDGKRRGGGRENHNNNDGALGTGPTLYEKARAAAWPRAGAGASATAPAAVVGGAAAAPAAAAPAAPVVAAPPPPPPAQQQQQPPPPVSAAAPPAVIVLDSSDDEDVKMEPANEGGGGGERGEREEEPPSPSPPSFFPLPAAAGPAPSSWPRHPLSEAATATATATTKCLVRGRVVQATSSLKFMDPATGEALPEFGLEVELEESARGGGSGGGSGGNGSGGSGGSGEEEEGFAPLTRRPAALSHALVSGLLGGISPRDLVEEYAREGGREALLGKLGRVKEFFDGFDGLLGVEARKKEEEENAPSTATAAAPAAASLVVVGWWEA